MMRIYFFIKMIKKIYFFNMMKAHQQKNKIKLKK